MQNNVKMPVPKIELINKENPEKGDIAYFSSFGDSFLGML